MIQGLLLDLDGTIYRGSEAVPGAIDFVAGLADRGVQHLFVTNRSNRTPEVMCHQLRGYGVHCKPEDILTSAEATAEWIDSGSFYCIGEDSLTSALENQGLKRVDPQTSDPQPPDYVVVGLDRHVTYQKLAAATRWIAAGATLVGTNPDRAVNSNAGIAPGAGSILAAVSAATGVQPTIIGKPETAMIKSALQRLGLAAENVVMVGDNLETDIRGGINAGLRTALMLTGISTKQDLMHSDLAPTWVASTFGALTDQLFAGY